MNTNRYYFPNLIEDDTLSILAVQAKELLQQNENIVNIFQVNNDLLYGHSPRQVLFLMKQNNKSIFSSSPSYENNPSDAKSYEGLSTPVTRNPDISNMPRRHLPLDDAEENVYHFATLEPSTPVRRQTVVGSSKHKAILNPVIDETATSDEQFAIPIGSTGSPEAGKQESPRSAEAGKQESPRSAEIAKMTADLSMAEKELRSPAKMVGSIHASRQESPRCAEVSIMTTSLPMAEKELGSPAEVVGNIKLGNQESPRSTEITIITSSLTVDDKESRSLIRDEKMAGTSATKTDTLNPKENAGKSDNPDSTKDFSSHAEGVVMISKPTIIGSETPSPVKRSKMCSISAFDIQELASPAEKVGMVDSSPEDTEVIVSPMPGYKMNISPNEASKGIARGERKRKSLSPRKRNTTPFRSIPRVIQLAGESEIDIEVPCDLEDNAIPTTSRSSSADYRSDSIKDIKIAVVGESETETSPKTLERYSRPSGRAIFISSSRTVSGTNSPGSDKDVFAGKHPSDIPSMVATSDRSCKSESSSADIETDPFSLKHTILKFNTLLVLRDQVAQKMFCSLLSFQTSTQFLCSYVHNVTYIILKIGVSDKEYSTEELKENVNDATAIALKLTKKLTSWKTDIDLEVNTWHKCLKQIQQLKAQNEPLLTREGKLAVTSEVVQVYEYEVKAIWKKMDEMIMMGDSRRALFSHIAHDLEKLMKMFVKCLILVGILQLR